MGTGTYVEPALSTKVKTRSDLDVIRGKKSNYHANADIEEDGASKTHDDGEERNLEK